MEKGVTMNAEYFAENVIALFRKHCDSLAVDEPGEDELRSQAAYEQKMLSLICEYKGHEMDVGGNYCIYCFEVSN